MKIDKNYKGLIDEVWRYKIEGNIETVEGLEIDLDKSLYVTGSIKAGVSIKAGESIKAGGSIKAGESSGIVAGLSITCKTTLSFGLRLFAGVCSWREIDYSDKTVTCGKLENGTIEYGILKELGLPNEDKVEDRTEEAIKLLKDKGYKIVKE